VRRSRCSNRSPSSASRRRICWLTAGWAIRSRSAARVKWASSATATKYARCRSSISNRLFAVRAYLTRSRAALAAASEMAAQLTSTDCAA